MLGENSGRRGVVLKRLSILAVALCALRAAPVMAQASAAAPTECELHVWPGSGLNSVYHGWLHGGLVNGAVDGRDGYPEVPPDPLATAEQETLLAAAEPQHLLKLDGHRLIVHPDALPSRVIRSTPGRIEASASPCYAELIVDDVFLQQDVVNGSALKILFRYRNFGTWVQTRLSAFPPKQPGELEAALADVRRAYSANVERFAAALLAPPRKR
jgi:hypothetical protein